MRSTDLRSQAASATICPSQCVSRLHGPREPDAGHAGAEPVLLHWALVKPLVIQLIVCGALQRWFSKLTSRTPVHPVAGVPSQTSPYPPQTWFARKPRPMHDVFSRMTAWMSAIASPGAAMFGLTPLLSIPWPHSWSKIAACSPVLRQPPPDLKKLTSAPSQNALHVS